MKKIVLIMLMIVMTVFATSDAKKVRYLESIKDVIVAAQKTRGGTYNFLNGSDFAQFGVYEQRTKMKQGFKALNRQYKVVGPKLDKEFDKLYKQMKSLNKLAFELDPLTAFKAYSMLINKMIVLGDKAQTQLYDKSNKFDKRVSKVMTSEIMRLTEGLGKLRGLGSGIAARRECEDEEVDYMRAYVSEIQKNMNRVISSMVELNKSYGKRYPKGLNEKLTQYKKDVHYYISFANDRLIEKENINVNSNDYFDRGTDLISGALSFYKMNAKALKD